MLQCIRHQQVDGKSFNETYITEDCKRFGQSFTQQPNPFGKQLVQMLPEMLTHNDGRGERKVGALFTHTDRIYMHSLCVCLIQTYIFIGPVGSDQRAIQTRLYIVNLLIILRKHT